MGDGTGANESKNDPITFDVGNLVRFVGYNYTPEFIMVGNTTTSWGLCWDVPGMASARGMMYILCTGSQGVTQQKFREPI